LFVITTPAFHYCLAAHNPLGGLYAFVIGVDYLL